MSDVQMFRSSCIECVEFLNQRRSRPVSMECRHEEGQTDKHGLYTVFYMNQPSDQREKEREREVKQNTKQKTQVLVLLVWQGCVELDKCGRIRGGELEMGGTSDRQTV